MVGKSSSPGHATATAALGQLTPYEVATGFPLGAGTFTPVPGGILAQRARPARARAAIETVVLEALQRPPCVVQFSGGRDSSAILAVAADLARRHGLPAPLPYTTVFPGENETSEENWQELVVRHLGLREWVRADAGDDADLLGPAAQQVLLRHGVIWSPLLATRAKYMAVAAGGSLVSGEGGDEVLGARRPANLSALMAARDPAAIAGAARRALTDVAPRAVRVERWRRRFGAQLGLEWLQPRTRSEYIYRSAHLWASEPLAWPHAVQWMASCRHVTLGVATMAALAEEAGATFCAPFLDGRLVAALARAFGVLGPASRTEAMQSIFGSLLPKELIARKTKAVFTLPAWGPRTRDFVSRWAGTGVDADLVDIAALRRHWSGPRPSAMTFCLLHAAWLAER